MSKKDESPFGESAKHGSFGAIQISRVSGDARLFMSPHRHHHFIILQITRASVARHISNDWFHGSGEVLVEVALSEAQFASAITSLNMGAGTPCMLVHTRAGSMIKEDDPPESVGTKEVYSHEFKAAATKAMAGVKSAINTLKRMTGSGIKPNAASLRSVTSDLERAHQAATDSMPWVAQQFEEAMEKQVASAKAEVEAHALGGMRALALEAIASNLSPADRQRIISQITSGEKS